MDAIMEALAFALLIGGQFLAVIAVARSNATQAARGAEGRGLRSTRCCLDGNRLNRDRGQAALCAHFGFHAEPSRCPARQI